MNRRSIISISAMTAFGLALLPGSAVGQQKSLKEQLTGEWTLVSNDNTLADGTKRQLYGSDPKGTLILAANGQYATITLRSDRPKFKSNNRLQGTPEENQAAVHGANASFGTWSVDEASKSLILRFEGNMFPNLEGTDSKRSATLTGDELKVSNPAPGTGGKSEIVYKRAK